MVMRSLHVIGSRRSGGAERFFLRLTAALARRGESVACALPPDSELVAALHPAVTQRHVKMRSVFDPFARARVSSTIKALGVDIVQTYMGRATRLTHVAPRRSGPVHVARLGGYYDIKGYRHAHAWVANARGIRDYLVDEGLPAERVHYIGNFVDPCEPVPAARSRQLRDSLSLETHCLTLVCLGRLHANKAFDVMLEAFARLPDQLRDRSLRLVMVGDGPLRDPLREQARALGVDARVRWVGWSDRPEEYLQLADLFVCPSRHEPLGNVVLEAWSVGVPVLASNTGGLSELIRDGDNGVLAAPDDPDALAQRIQAMLENDPQRLRGLVQGGARSLEMEHSEASVVAAYQQLYRKLSGND
jgi:glycosyltransferase involved in cell wall biosynthesis